MLCDIERDGLVGSAKQGVVESLAKRGLIEHNIRRNSKKAQAYASRASNLKRAWRWLERIMTVRAPPSRRCGRFVIVSAVFGGLMR